MSTRALITFYEGPNNSRPICAVFKHWDGYITGGLGDWLKKRLANVKIVNGYNDSQPYPEYANTMGCLAAAIIGELKLHGENKGIIGDVYIYPANTKMEDTDCEFWYKISPSRTPAPELKHKSEIKAVLTIEGEE